MDHSNNFMANQILLALGAAHAGPPATLQKGVDAVNQFAATTLSMKGFTVAEGSGLSRKNRLSADHMLTILQAYRPFAHLLRSAPAERYKTGSLKGVRTRAGYLLGDGQQLYPYVIFINTPGKSPEPLLDLLKQMLTPGPKR